MFDLHIKPLVRDSYVLEGRIEDKELLTNLKKDIDKGIKKENNNYQTNVQGKMTSFKYFNNNKNFEKFIRYVEPCFKKVSRHDLQIHDSWGNILEADDYVRPHDHVASLLSGILYLSNGEGTHFHDFNKYITAEEGKFVLFDPIITHEVKPSKLRQKRYSIAFNFNLLSTFRKLK